MTGTFASCGNESLRVLWVGGILAGVGLNVAMIGEIVVGRWGFIYVIFAVVFWLDCVSRSSGSFHDYRSHALFANADTLGDGFFGVNRFKA